MLSADAGSRPLSLSTADGPCDVVAMSPLGGGSGGGSGDTHAAFLLAAAPVAAEDGAEPPHGECSGSQTGGAGLGAGPVDGWAPPPRLELGLCRGGQAPCERVSCVPVSLVPSEELQTTFVFRTGFSDPVALGQRLTVVLGLPLGRCGAWVPARVTQPCPSQLVELKNGETYNGHLVSCDNWMNINLREVICTSRVSGRHSLSWPPTGVFTSALASPGAAPDQGLRLVGRWGHGQLLLTSRPPLVPQL